MARYRRTERFSMLAGVRSGRLLSSVALGMALVFGLGAAGCRTSESDIHRWADTLQGPRKLAAVVTHDKFPLSLRVDAAMTLIEMKPRGGKPVGIEGVNNDPEQPGVVNAIASLVPAERARIIDKLIPELIQKMNAPPPRAQGGQAASADQSSTYKDGAFALLSYDDGSLITDENLKKQLKEALAKWCLTDFAARLDDSSQMFGVEQVLRALGAQGVKKLPDLIKPGAKKIDHMAALIADLGDAETKARASKALVVVAEEVDSDRWKKQKAPAVEAANKESKLEPTPRQFQAQLDQYQEEELLRVFGSMKKVGGEPSVNYLIKYAENKDKPVKRRAAAIAALEGNLDKNKPAEVEAMLKLAGAKNTPADVRDQALRRVGEMPRKMVVNKLYELFRNENWKIRWVAAELVLKMSDTSQVGEFMRHLARAKGMAITEPLRYGALIGQMTGKKTPEQVADTYARPGHSVQARLSALGYYYNYGTKSELPKVQRYETDKMKVPKCNKDAQDCAWQCTITQGKSQVTKDIATVGDFVSYCVEPAMKKKKTAPKKAEKKKKK